MLVLFSIILSIIILQVITLYLDNRSCMNDFFEFIDSGNIATAYSNRGILLTLSRTVFFTIPPLLGYLTISLSNHLLLNLTIFVIFINLFITFIQGCIYNKNELGTIFSLRVNIQLFKSYIFIIGIISFSLFLLTPYFLNLIAVYRPDVAIWVVQLNNILNSIFVFYLVFIFEPLVSKEVDKKHDIKIYKYHAFLARLYGRLIPFLICIVYLVV
jgi:hypothetical protein